MVKSNPVQLLRESHTRALFVPEKSPFGAKMRVLHQGKSHEGSTFFFKKDHILANIPVLGNLPHIIIIFDQGHTNKNHKKLTVKGRGVNAYG